MKKQQILEQYLRMPILAILLTLAGCSSSGEIPKPDSETSATFRLGKVGGDTTTQDSKTATNTTNVLVTFSAHVFDNATGQAVPPNQKFNIIEAGNLIQANAILDMDGFLQWQLNFPIQNGVTHDYTVHTFHIVAQSPHKGSQIVRLGVNPSKRGKEAVIDLTDGSLHLPIPAENPHPIINEKGITEINPLPDFQVANIRASTRQPVAASLSPATGQFTAYTYGFEVCLKMKLQNYPTVKDDWKFLVKGFGMPDQIVAFTHDNGCLSIPARIENFQYFSQERWFKKNFSICADNDGLRKSCINHTFYFNPWSTKADSLWNDGKPLEYIQELPHFIDGDPMLAAHPPRLRIDGYVADFNGRKFAIDSDLNISTQRFYDIYFTPSIERWVINGEKGGYQSERIENGQFKVRTLLLKTHGEAIDQFPDTELGRRARDEELKCFNKDDIFAVLADLKARHECYVRAYIDNRDYVVEVKNGSVLLEQAELNFTDLRYASSRNLLYFEIAPNDPADMPSGISSMTFVGAFSPLDEASSRRLHEIENSALVFRKDNRPLDNHAIKLRDLENSLENWTNPISKDQEEFLQQSKAKLSELAQKSFNYNFDSALDNVLKSRDPNLTSDDKSESAKLERNIVFRAVKDYLDPEPVSKILEIIEQGKSNIIPLAKLWAEPREILESRIPKSIRIYQNYNKLELAGMSGKEEKFSITERDKLLANYHESKFAHTESTAEPEAIIYLSDDIRNTLEKSCELLYPDSDSPEAIQEAKNYAKNELEKATKAYEKQHEILCKIHDVVAAKIYDNVSLDVNAKGCEDTRPICNKLHVPSDITDQLNPISRLLHSIISVFDDGQAPNACPHPISDEENSFIDSLLQGDTNLLQKVLQTKLFVERTALTELAAQYLPLMPFAKIRYEVVKRQNPSYQLDHIFQDPKSLDPKEFDERFVKPVVKQQRCKRNPLGYLSLTASEHIVQMRGAPIYVHAGSTNMTVSSNISIGESNSSDQTAGTSKYTSISNSGDVSTGTHFGFGMLGLSEKLDFGLKNSVFAGQNWYLSRGVSHTSYNSTSSGENSSRTLNADEVSFQFSADTQKCIAIQKWDSANEISIPGGYLLCKDNAETKNVVETWWFVYLYFRGYSPLHDAPSDFIMRPWTLLIHGQEQFSKFKSLLQNSVTHVTFQKNNIVNPDQLMNDSFTKHLYYRERRDLPGLLKVRKISLR